MAKVTIRAARDLLNYREVCVGLRRVGKMAVRKRRYGSDTYVFFVDLDGAEHHYQTVADLRKALVAQAAGIKVEG